MAPLAWVVALGAVLAFTGGCAARAPRSNGMGQVSEVESAALGLTEVEGKVTRVDPREGTILIQPEAHLDEATAEEPLELQVGDGTAVFLQGGIGTLDDIEEGALIRATFSNHDDGLVASWVEIPRPHEPPRQAPQGVPEADEGAASQGR